jgi:2-keto-4-pentenoate hydratase/2-oxohepta-3-ene-1,7-dioic acid hydratase in catechol pathway
MNSITLDQTRYNPSKIVCIGRNYVEHIKELDNEVPEEPVIFMKPNSAIADDIFSSASDEIHFEGEISFLIRNKSLHGVGFGLDLTKRTLQSALKAKGLPWERAKAFDKSAVFSHFVSFDCPVQNLRMELHINEQLTQIADYSLMIYKPHDIVAEISRFISLEDNDLIMTGTPKGVGKIQVGDAFTGKIFDSESLLLESSWEVK